MTADARGDAAPAAMPPAPEPPPPAAAMWGVQWRAPLAAGLAGFAVMALELTAVRLMAPHFGDSAFVWTNVIGVILIALAIGAYAGGRIAESPRGDGWLATIFWGAAVWTAVVPWFAPGLGDYLLPQDLKLEHAMPALVRGSLVATVVLFAPGVALAGCLTPMLVRRLALVHGQIGRASGAIAATSTIGSLIGTFATTHWLVPELGSRVTIWLSAVLFAAVALLVTRSRQRTIPVLSLAILVPALVLVGAGPTRAILRAASPGDRVLADVESRYQFLRVIERDESDGVATLLQINEGLDSFHSVRVGEDVFTGGRYYDWFAAVPLLLDRRSDRAKLRIASLGDAAGTFTRLFGRVWPGVVVDSVELDPAVVALGDRHFGGREGTAGRAFSGLDARVFVERTKHQFDVVLVDAYEHQVYVPAHLASVEFFQSVRRALQPGGIVAVNSGGRSFEDPVVRALGATMAEVFAGSWAFRVPRSRNFMLLARREGAIDPGRFERGVLGLAPGLVPVVESLAQTGAWRRFGAEDGTVLDDDRPLLDRLQDVELSRAPTERDLLPPRGSRGPDEVAAAARAAIAAGAYERARDALTESREATPEIRELAGDARWYLNEPVGAAAEYRAAQATIADSAGRERLKRKLGILEEDRLAPARHAAEIATRNGWLAVAAVVGLAALCAASWWLAARGSHRSA